MSWLSKATGIHINPLKGEAHLSTPDPLGTLKDIAHNPLPLLAAVALPGIGGALGGALGSLGGAAGSALGAIPGASQAIGAIEGAAGAIPGASSVGGALKAGLGKAGEFLTANGGKNALGVAQGLTTALQQQKANSLANKALGSAEGAYAEKAPLRAAGLAGLMRPDVGNPYARSV